MSLCGCLLVLLGVLLAVALGSAHSIDTNRDVDLIGESSALSASSSPIYSSPIITTIAGSGISGPQSGDFAGDGSSAKTARLFSSEDVAVGRDGRIYIADKVNHRIRMIHEGIISFSCKI